MKAVTVSATEKTEIYNARGVNRTSIIKILLINNNRLPYYAEGGHTLKKQENDYHQRRKDLR